MKSVNSCLRVSSQARQLNDSLEAVLSNVVPPLETGGERGIRTLDTLLEYARFPGVCLQPLGHLSRRSPVVRQKQNRPAVLFARAIRKGKPIRHAFPTRTPAGRGRAENNLKNKVALE